MSSPNNLDKKNVVIIENDLKALIPKFIDYIHIEIKSSREAIIKNNMEELESIFHKLKGSLGGYGFSELGNIAKEINLLLKNNKGKEIPQEEILKEIVKIEKYLDSMEVVYK